MEVPPLMGSLGQSHLLIIATLHLHCFRRLIFKTGINQGSSQTVLCFMLAGIHMAAGCPLTPVCIPEESTHSAAPRRSVSPG